MVRIITKSVLLNYVVQFTMHLRWACDHLLRQSFFRHSNAVPVPEYVDDFNVACFKEVDNGGESAECAVCLCRIEGDDEVRELRCDHFFHRVCLDRWLGYGYFTCPVCRNVLKAPPIVFVDFPATGGRGGRDQWWLR